MAAALVVAASAAAEGGPLFSAALPEFKPAIGDGALLGGLSRSAGAGAEAEPQPQTEGIEETAVDAATPVYGAADSLEFEFSIGPAFDSDETTVGLLDAGVHWFVAEGVSVGAFAELLYFDADATEAWGGGLGLLARWHFVRERDFSLFIEGGCGFALFSDDVPDGGTEHDFTPRAAFGATYALSDGVRLVGKAGWFHISNAQTGPGNPGLDSFAVAIGLSFTLGR